jgi:hypothetical protein
MKRSTVIGLLLLAWSAPGVRAQSAIAPKTLAAPTAAEDTAGIRAAAMDYIEGWYAGDSARMARALHPELAKRMVYTDARGHSVLNQMSAMTLVNSTRAGGGKDTPVERRQEDFTILDLYRNAAVARIVASDWIDYLQLARWNGEWKIVNVLWELKPRPAGP